MNISFSLPKAKKYCTGHVQVSPFPLTEISDECDRRQFVGIFTGMSVEVFNVDDIRELYEKGFYGSGAKTKVQSKILAPNTLKNSLFATNSQYMAKKELERKLGNQNPNEVTLKVLADGFGQHSTGELTFVTETDPFPFEESLILSLEEAFFLHNSLRCLKIVNFEQTSETTTEEFLNTCCALKKNFILYFTAYHYYRSKGWIVKDGLKFGGDFLLYYKGPKYYHASYVVIVNDSENNINVLNLQSNYRVAETANKDVIITNIIRPNGVSYDDPKRCIDQLSQFMIDEFLPKRFQPHQGGSEVPSTSQNWKKIKLNDPTNNKL